MTKRITLKLGPQAEQNFIIVIRCPNCRRDENLLSVINIGVLTYKDEKFGVNQSFEQFLANNYDGNMKNFLHDRKKLSQLQRIQVLLAGKLQIPKLFSIKELK